MSDRTAQSPLLMKAVTAWLWTEWWRRRWIYLWLTSGVARHLNPQHPFLPFQGLSRTPYLQHSTLFCNKTMCDKVTPKLECVASQDGQRTAAPMPVPTPPGRRQR
jgi:hypothetical protein